MLLPNELKKRIKRFQGDETPLSQDEAAWSEAVIDLLADGSFYHGGASGLIAGDCLMTGKELGCDVRGWYGQVPRSKRWVYFSNSQDLAHFYARTLRLLKYTAGLPNRPAALYQVRPLDRVLVDLSDLRAHRSLGHSPQQAIAYAPLAFVSKRAAVVQVLEELPI